MSNVCKSFNVVLSECLDYHLYVFINCVNLMVLEEFSNLRPTVSDAVMYEMLITQ